MLKVKNLVYKISNFWKMNLSKNHSLYSLNKDETNKLMK